MHIFASNLHLVSNVKCGTVRMSYLHEELVNHFVKENKASHSSLILQLPPDYADLGLVGHLCLCPPVVKFGQFTHQESVCHFVGQLFLAEGE